MLRNLTVLLLVRATCIICYKYDKKVKTNETMEEVKYYATDYLKSIAAGKDLVFNINDVKRVNTVRLLYVLA